MPRRVHRSILEFERHSPSGPTSGDKPEGKRVVERRSAYIITDILAGNTDTKVNPYWGKWAIYDGKNAPARRLQDGHDERQP